MAVNLLPKDYKKEVAEDQNRRLVSALGLAALAVIIVNTALLLPLWVLFKAQEIEFARELDAIKKSPEFIRVAEIESEIGRLNEEITKFSKEEDALFSASPAIKSILEKKPVGIGISNISFFVSEQAERERRPSRITVSGISANRELLLAYTEDLETNEFFQKVHSPITNLLKDADFDYSLVLDLK